MSIPLPAPSPRKDNWKWMPAGVLLIVLLIAGVASFRWPVEAAPPAPQGQLLSQPTLKPAEAPVIPSPPDVFIQPTAEEREAAIGDLEQVPEKWRFCFEPRFDARQVPDPGPGDWLTDHPEPHQSFDLFLRENPNRPDGVRSTIYLLPLEEFDEYVPQMDGLRDFMQTYFGMPAKVLPCHAFPEGRVTERINQHTHRTQWLTTDMLRELRERLPEDAYCLLGVTMTDLYPDPKWNFVFGQATFKQRVGVYSFARFDPAFWGQERSDDGRLLMLRRSCGLIAHETGHMFGIRHCVYYQCVMNGSNSQPESDSVPMRLCPVCLRKLQWAIEFDPEKREGELVKVLERLGITDQALTESEP